MSRDASSRAGENARGCKASGEAAPQAYSKYVEDAGRPTTQQTRADSSAQQKRRETCGLLAALALSLLATAPAAVCAAQPDSPPPPADLPPSAASFLEEVAPLITEAEREAFLGLEADYQRRAFVEKFWQVRDPFPDTARNELRERWEERVEAARQRFPDGLADDRARVFLANGEPMEVMPGRCGTLLVPLELWHYRGSDVVRGDFWIVFRRRGARYELWAPTSGLSSLTNAGSLGASPAAILRAVEEECVQGSRLAQALSRAADWLEIERSGAVYPDPGDEWVHTFLTYSTEVPEEAEPLPAELEVGFPGVRGGRTVVQGVVRVPRAEAESAPEGGESFDYLVDGEVLRRGELFEHFRYRFRLPAGDVGGEAIPLVFQRYLRPGAYRLLVRVEELASQRFFRAEHDLEVPFVRPGEPVETAAAAPAGSPDEDAAPAGATGAAESAPSADPAAEANRALGRGDHALRLLPPPEGLQVGVTRLEAVATGEGIARVRFHLDGRPVMSKSRPPYSVELDLGEVPRTHEVVAVAVDERDEELARDSITVNAGPHRFAVRLTEPQPGRAYASSLRASAEVEVPEGDALDRVELYLNDELVAALYQPPFAQPILLPPASEVAYVRAVAYLADGNSAEDLVFVNAPENLERIDVRMVELYTTVLDRRGRPVEGLGRGEFTVLEDGVPQTLRRFELVRDLPIYAGVLLDTSSSMVEEMSEALAAASRFFQTVIQPKDRAAVVTFNHQTELAVRFTNNPEVLAGGLAGIGAAGGTALWDSLVYTLYYFSGVSGKRAIVLLSDGDDQGSRYRFDDALDYARRTGIAIYAIGLGPAGTEPTIRTKLMRLASETGGQSFFVQRASELARVYETIEGELRTQYLLAYQSTNAESDDAFREVEVRVARPGAEAKTLRGYYP